ncbi:MAG: GTPase [Deltaproteobacteria bacterium]|nr:GTPase [Deltaproteobacteria bacterium]
MKKNCIIMGAAGRDFHNFLMLYRDDMEFRVAAFTAAQIPFIERRVFPPELAGPFYPKGIPIYPEEMLAELIKKEKIDTVVFSYSDVSHEYVMHRASLVTSLNADFVLIGAEKTMLKSSKPVISVCAVRTGCGKSGVGRIIAKEIKNSGLRPAVIRHPMPYGDLLKQRLQRFATLVDLDNANCTIEEREEYEPLIEAGFTVFAGVDYKEILFKAEREADVIIWDGGNNDLPFIKPDIEIVVVDPLRPGHETSYYPGEANLRRAHIVVINKADSAKPEDIALVADNVKAINPDARIIRTSSEVFVDGDIKDKDVLVVEDGPTLTHGGMSFGAGIAAAKKYGARPVDCAEYAAGSIRETLKKFPHIKNLLPAMGYSKEQVMGLEETINSTPCDAALIATPADITKLIDIKKPVFRVRYKIADMDEPGIKGAVAEFLKRVIPRLRVK